ncbi:MAG TPA: M36 family metallopeptidase, partial [Saprospiraceae bacterium]|nr:M36 family metallopeptidase [Saprospiraceae bacterium]
FFAGNRFVTNLASKINTTTEVIPAETAIENLSSALGLSREHMLLKRESERSEFIFDKGNLAREDISAKLSYQPIGDKVKLAWDILLPPVGNHDLWNSRVDAVTGEVLTQANWALYCNADESGLGRTKEECLENPGVQSPVLCPSSPRSGDAQYRVWAAPCEDPQHGSRTLVINPADSLASPYGWHDIDGQPGAEYTITAGNNVYTYLDRDNVGSSAGNEPDGGQDHIFDFPYDSTWEPEQYTAASQVNLFYWMNYLHDFFYHFGFDEDAGNFQKNNYNRGGSGNDFIWAVSQSGANTDLRNNGEFVYKPEGTSPSLFLFVFDYRKRYLHVDAPDAVAGLYITNVPTDGWGAGAYVNEVPVSGEVVMVDDGVDEPSTADACQPMINAAELQGKIAFIDRGGCQFAYKALQAQNAGAIGVIICGTDDSEYNIAAGPDAPNVHIPVLAIAEHDARIIREYIGRGLKVSMSNTGQHAPLITDSALENMMIAHEFGHGISLRIAGGPDKACLDNAEQMGEGWSDFFGLVTTVRPGDTGLMKKGLGTYVTQESIEDAGFRRHPYSTDITIDPLTYADVAANPEKHALGEVWASMLWDMYWALSDKYGWSADPFDVSSGNYRAIRLVIDGLKNMACDPGFVDGRNAIFAADSVLYGGEDACLLWSVFARRGLGYSADQGSSQDPGDQKEAFDLSPYCEQKVVIQKSVTPFIQAGDDIQVTIKVHNYKPETITNVIVRDELPDGVSFKTNSSNYPPVFQGDQVYFDLGNMIFDREKTITYTLQTTADSWSVRKFLDVVPASTDTMWSIRTVGAAASNPWSITDTIPAHSGTYAWSSKEIPDKSRQVLTLNPDKYSFHVEGENPALRFYHRYQTQAGLNGGLVEVREVGTPEWEQVDEDMLRNGYDEKLDYRTFITPNLHAFSGTSGNGYQATYVDLRRWIGKDIQVRFRFGTYTNTNNGDGWRIDDIEFMDLLSYNGEACVITDQGDTACIAAGEDGTIVDSHDEMTSGTNTIQKIESLIYPNPASDAVTISLSLDEQEDVEVSLLTMDGRMVSRASFNVDGHRLLTLNTSEVPPGLYLIKLNTAKGQAVSKLVIQK